VLMYCSDTNVGSFTAIERCGEYSMKYSPTIGRTIVASLLDQLTLRVERLQSCCASSTVNSAAGSASSRSSEMSSRW